MHEFYTHKINVKLAKAFNKGKTIKLAKSGSDIFYR